MNFHYYCNSCRYIVISALFFAEMTNLSRNGIYLFGQKMNHFGQKLSHFVKMKNP